jgi:hypothetical protein
VLFRSIEDLEGKWLLGPPPSAFRFPAGSIVLPGMKVVLYLGVDGESRPEDGIFYAGNKFAPLGASGAVALCSGANASDSTLFIDYVAWGSAGASYEAQALAAGIWPPASAVDVMDLRAGGGIASLGAGTGPARWIVDNTPTPLAENDTQVQTPLSLSELLVAPLPGEAAALEIHNRSDLAVSIGGLLVGTLPPGGGSLLAGTIPEGTSVGPNGRLVLRLGDAPMVDGEVRIAGLPVLDPAGGELALLITADWTNWNNILGYIGWGSGTPALLGGAVAAGFWAGEALVSTEGILPGSSLTRDLDAPGAASWRLDPTPSLGLPNEEKPPEWNFVRSDCNQDGGVDISDAIATLQFLFIGGFHVECEDAADSNDDGTLDISDAIYILGFLFLGGSQHKPPLTCGTDGNGDTLGCLFFRGCEEVK